MFLSWQRNKATRSGAHDPTRGESIPLVRTVLRYTIKGSVQFFLLQATERFMLQDKQGYCFIGCDVCLQFRGFPVRSSACMHTVAASSFFNRLGFFFVVPLIGKRSYLLARGPYEQIICASPTTGVFPCCRCTFHNRVLEFPTDFLERSKSSSSWLDIGNFGQQQLCCLVVRICVTYAGVFLAPKPSTVFPIKY